MLAHEPEMYVVTYRSEPYEIPGGGAFEHKEVQLKIEADSFSQAVERALSLEDKHGPLVLVSRGDHYEEIAFDE